MVRMVVVRACEVTPAEAAVLSIANEAGAKPMTVSLNTVNADSNVAIDGQTVTAISTARQ